jgi:hypothetical protein
MERVDLTQCTINDSNDCFKKNTCHLHYPMVNKRP